MCTTIIIIDDAYCSLHCDVFVFSFCASSKLSTPPPPKRAYYYYCSAVLCYRAVGVYSSLRKLVLSSTVVPIPVWLVVDVPHKNAMKIIDEEKPECTIALSHFFFFLIICFGHRRWTLDRGLHSICKVPRLLLYSADEGNV